MIANIVIGTIIFGYAGWAFIRHINKSKKGKCASCKEESTHTTNNSCCEKNY